MKGTAILKTWSKDKEGDLLDRAEVIPAVQDGPPRPEPEPAEATTLYGLALQGNHY